MGTCWKEVTDTVNRRTQIDTDEATHRHWIRRTTIEDFAGLNPVRINEQVDVPPGQPRKVEVIREDTGDFICGNVIPGFKPDHGNARD